MAAKTLDVQELVDHVQSLGDVGWLTEKIDGSYRMTSPDGKRFVLRPARVNRKELQALAQHVELYGGTSQDEAEAAAHNTKYRQQTAAAKKAQTASAANKAALIKAAGPYLTEPEPCDLDWLQTKHPTPWMRWMYITAKAARAILDEQNIGNRNISDPETSRHELVMVSDQWRLTHQGPAFDTRGILQDGQHRLTALAEAGEQLGDPDYQKAWPVFVGMDPDNFTAIDEGRLRTAAQMLRKQGAANANKLFGVLRAVVSYQSPHPREGRKTKLSSAVAFPIYESDAARFDEATDFAVKNYGRNRISYAAFGAAYYLIGRANGYDNPYVQAFFQGLSYNRKHNTGLVLPHDDPRAVLLRKFISTRCSPLDGLCWFILSWNNAITGAHPGALRYSDKTPIPQILRCKPGDGATPRAFHGEIA